MFGDSSPFTDGRRWAGRWVEGAALTWTSLGPDRTPRLSPSPSSSPLGLPLRSQLGPQEPTAQQAFMARQRRPRCQAPLTIVFLRLCWGWILLAVLLLLLFLQDEGGVSAEVGSVPRGGQCRGGSVPRGVSAGSSGLFTRDTATRRLTLVEPT